MGHLQEFDQVFIQAPDHRPKLAVSQADGIPTIDLSPIFNDSPPAGSEFPHDLVQQIASACTEWGFFLVVNHGVPPEKRRRMEAAAREFFGQSLEEKRKVRRNEGVATGYFDMELTKNVRDWKEVFDFVVEDPTLIPASSDPDETELTQLINQWPEYPPEFRYISHCPIMLLNSGLFSNCSGNQENKIEYHEPLGHSNRGKKNYD